MRFFKRREEPVVELRRTRSQGGPCPDPRTNEIAMISRQTNKNRPMMLQRTSLTSSHKSIGDLAKKLNCAGTKVKDEEMLAGGEQSILVGVGNGGVQISRLKRSSSWGGGLRRSNEPHHFDPSITRPVLITIKDGDLWGMAPQPQLKVSSSPSRSIKEGTRKEEIERSFAAAWKTSSQRSPPGMSSSPAKNSPFKFGASARAKKDKVTFATEPPSPQSVADPIDAHGARLNLTITTNDGISEPQLSEEALPPYRTAKEMARRERWKRGLEMEKQRKNKTPSPQECKSAFSGDDDDSTFEDTTHFTYTTGDSSYLSGDFGSVGSYSSGTDDGTETDDSGTDFTDGSSRCHRKQRNKSLHTPKSPFRYNPSIGPCSNRQNIMSGIAEDFGIVVRMLWSDGSACIGTAAAITKETVSSCRDES